MRIEELVERDMIAIKVSHDIQWTVVATPDYLADHGRPLCPANLAGHVCIGFRYPVSGVIYRWEFEDADRNFSIDTKSAVLADDSNLLVTWARAGLGLAYLPRAGIAADLVAGQLESVLDAFLPTSPGLRLYFPARSQA